MLITKRKEEHSCRPSAQQLAAQEKSIYVLAEKLAQRILKGDYAPVRFFPAKYRTGRAVRRRVNGSSRSGETLTAKGMNFTVRALVRTRVMPQETGTFWIQSC